MAMSDMTLGQYIPADSLMHRMDARVKILLALAFMVLVFLVNTVQGYAMVFVLLIAAVALSKVPVKYVLKGLKPIIFILILTFSYGSWIWNDISDISDSCCIHNHTLKSKSESSMSCRTIFAEI